MPRAASVSKGAVKTACTSFRSELDRANDLHARIADRGYTEEGTAPNITTKRLAQPDRRDVAQFVFFEVAAAFEDFVRRMFRVEVRATFKVTEARSEFLMGSPDKGLDGVMGWTVPSLLVLRAENLLGADSFHAGLLTSLGQAEYDRLVHAHAVRNRIAHGKGTGKALNAYLKALAWGGVKTKARQGCGPGRFLREYPSGATANDKVFHRFLGAYRKYADEAEKALP